MNNNLYQQIKLEMKRKKLEDTKDQKEAVTYIKEVILDNMSQELFNRKNISSVVNSIEIICDLLEEEMSEEEKAKFYMEKLMDSINAYNLYHSTQILLTGIQEKIIEPQLIKEGEYIKLKTRTKEYRKQDLIFFFYEMDKINQEKIKRI